MSLRRASWRPLGVHRFFVCAYYLYFSFETMSSPYCSAGFRRPAVFSLSLSLSACLYTPRLRPVVVLHASLAHLTRHFFTWSSNSSVGSLSPGPDTGRSRFLLCPRSGKSAGAPVTATGTATAVSASVWVPCEIVDPEGTAVLLLKDEEQNNIGGRQGKG